MGHMIYDADINRPPVTSSSVNVAQRERLHYVYAMDGGVLGIWQRGPNQVFDVRPGLI